MIVFIFNEKELLELAQHVINNYSEYKVFTLVGDLGAGKTTFVKAFSRILDISEEVSSPTFSLVNQYQSSNEVVTHMDLYRIESDEELYDFGFEEYFDNQDYVFIEWPEIATSLLDSMEINRMHIHISTLENNIRKFTFQKM